MPGFDVDSNPVDNGVAFEFVHCVADIERKMWIGWPEK
jgi:hypothetical protein